MYCGKCGKEMPDTAKFCPNCGAENLEVKPSIPVGRPSVPSVPAFGLDGGKLRVALMVLGALHLLLFFFLSYGEVHLMSAMNTLFGSDFPSRLTALNTISLLKGCVDLGIEGASTALVEVSVLALLPVALGIAVLVLNLKKSGNVGLKCVVLSVLTLLAYGIFQADLRANEDLGLSLEGGMLAMKAQPKGKQ